MDAAVGLTVFIFKVVKHSDYYSDTLAEVIYCKVSDNRRSHLSII